MAEHKCLPGVMAKCPYGDRPVCTYEDGSQCEKDNLAYLPPDIMEELQAYRAAGLSPDEIERLQEYMKPFTIQDMDRFREIMDAEKDGRLLVLPCKVGDKVWVIMENREIYSFVVRGISMSATCDDTILRLSNSFQWGSNLGKTWFLTRQEAEEALRKEADNG